MPTPAPALSHGTAASSSENSTYCGTSVAWTGSISVPIISPNTRFRPGTSGVGRPRASISMVVIPKACVHDTWFWNTRAFIGKSVGDRTIFQDHNGKDISCPSPRIRG